MNKQNLMRFVFSIVLSVYVGWNAYGSYSAGNIPAWRFGAYLAILAFIVISFGIAAFKPREDEE